MSTTEVHNSRTLEISMTPFFAPPLCPLRFGWLQRSLFRLALACLLSPIAARAQVSLDRAEVGRLAAMAMMM